MKHSNPHNIILTSFAMIDYGTTQNKRIYLCSISYINSLARQLKLWSGSKKMALVGARLSYIFHAVIPGLSFFLAMCCYAKLHSPLGISLTLLLLYGGFLYPMLKYHRITHPAKWPSPSMHGAFLFGVSVTMLFYYIQVLPNILWYL